MILVKNQLSSNCMPRANAWEIFDQLLKDICDKLRAGQQNYMFVSLHIPKKSNKTWSEPINIYIKNTRDHMDGKSKK
jgi:hypothetical protein